MWGKLGRNWTVASGPCVVPVTRHSEVKVLYLFVLWSRTHGTTSLPFTGKERCQALFLSVQLSARLYEACSVGYESPMVISGMGDATN